MKFSDLGLSPKVLTAVEAVGYVEPTPIQAQAIPFVIQGRDVLGIAQTGTGKTASFVLPMLNRLEKGRARARMPRSLIIEPTRELAAQVADSFELYGAEHKLTVALLIGGVSFDEQDRKLDRGADVLIATPGRLLDHFQRGKLLLTGVEILVIDEADRMLDMGFIPDVERISKLIPPVRQTLFFSATMPPEIQRLVKDFLKSPERIEATPAATVVGTIKQLLKSCPADPKGKRQALRDLVNELDVRNAIVFCNRKRDVVIVHNSLVRHGFDAAALHGDMDQHQRMATLEAFRNGEVALLVASDVAARGLDIPDVSHIINFDVPGQPEDYVHRIGRTGRAGREGVAAMLVTPSDFKAVKAITRLVRQDIQWIGEEPSFEERESRGGRRQSSRRGPRRAAAPAKAKSPQKKSRPRRDAKADANANAIGNGKTAQKPAPQKKASKANKREDTPRKTGMGDHVPNFMKRPVRSP